MQLRGAIALVTGAAQGLGKAFSESLLKRGAMVCLTDVQIGKGKEVESEFQEKYGKDKAVFILCDVRSEESLSKMFRDVVTKFGHIDLMVNNAGIADESRMRDMVDINLVAVLKGTNLAIDHMRKDQGGKGGVVINVASTAGLVPVYFSPTYCATKHGVKGFTLSCALNPDVKKLGIQFAVLCPAFTKTAMVDFLLVDSNLRDDAISTVNHIGLNEVDDVVKGFMTLVDSDNCNGDVITVTKGDGVQYHKKNGRSVKSRV